MSDSNHKIVVMKYRLGTTGFGVSVLWAGVVVHSTSRIFPDLPSAVRWAWDWLIAGKCSSRYLRQKVQIQVVDGVLAERDEDAGSVESDGEVLPKQPMHSSPENLVPKKAPAGSSSYMSNRSSSSSSSGSGFSRIIRSTRKKESFVSK